jgi:hypothetical protein
VWSIIGSTELCGIHVSSIFTGVKNHGWTFHYVTSPSTFQRIFSIAVLNKRTAGNNPRLQILAFCSSAFHICRNYFSLSTTWQNDILHILPYSDEGMRWVEDSTGWFWLFYCSHRDMLSFKVPRTMVRVLQKSWQCLELTHYTLAVLGKCFTISSLKNMESLFKAGFLCLQNNTLCCSVLQRNSLLHYILGMQLNSYTIINFFLSAASSCSAVYLMQETAWDLERI